jgi:predicted phosphodiesterase
MLSRSQEQMRRLWLADIHANLPAFEAVLGDAGVVDEIVFLGDVVGYGPHPSSCIDLLMAIAAKCVLGNHDAAVLSAAGRASRRPSHADWDGWTFDQLGDTRRSFLAAFPASCEIVSCGIEALALHHVPGAPYLHPDMSDSLLGRYLRAASHSFVICGHSHRRIDRTLGNRRFVCVPSVGQPRNRDARAGYVVEDDGELGCGFVSYDIERTVADVQSIGLEKGFCQRWIAFLRTGFDAEWSREHVPEGAPE